MQRVKKRRSASLRYGFTLIETGLALGVMAIMLMGLMTLFSSQMQNTQNKIQRDGLVAISNGIKRNFILILEAFEPVCSIVDDTLADDQWGWQNVSCSGTSPLPQYSPGAKTLSYFADFGSLSASNAARLTQEISNNMTPFCRFVSSDATSVVFRCDNTDLRMTNFAYNDPVAGYVNTWHALGNNLDVQNFPSDIAIEYDQYLATSNTLLQRRIATGDNFTLNLSDVYLDRIAYTRQKMRFVEETLKSYHVRRGIDEMNNPSPNGLSSSDDFFIPWVWQGLADITANIDVDCNVSNCSNIPLDDNFWRTPANTTRFSVVWKRLADNLFSGDYRYDEDGFGNPLRILTIANGCRGDITACTAGNHAPSAPATGYANADKPPFRTTIVNPDCTGVGVFPDFCRYEFIYAN